MVNVNAQKITRVDTYTDSFDGVTQDHEAELLRRELESNWSNDGVERIFVLSEN